MSILFFAGFDCFDTGVKGGSGVDKNDPIDVGIKDTPLADWLTVNYGSSYPTNAMINTSGVTGEEGYKVGSGKERRNTFILQAGRINNSVASARLNLKNLPSAGVVGKEWIYRVGFNLTDFTTVADTAASGAGIVYMMANGSGVNNIIIRAKDAQGVYYSFNGTIFARPVRGEPMHIELEFGMFAPTMASTFNVSVRLYVNGDYIGFFQPWSSSQSTVTQYSVIWNTLAQASATSQMTLGLSDIVVSDNLGPGGVDPGPLGPQLVLPVEISEVSAPNWTVTGGTAVEVLKDSSDATFITSPLASGKMDVALNMGLPVGADLNGLKLFARTRRDIGAASVLYYDAIVKRKSDDGILATTSNIPLTSNALNRTLLDIGKDRADYAGQLAFADTGLFNLNLNIKKNGA